MRYAVAGGMAAVAVAGTRLIWPVVEPMLSPLFLGAVVVSAWYGGLGPGLFATGLGLAAKTYFFVAPTRSLLVEDAMAAARLGLFVAIAFLISSLTGALRRARDENARLIAGERAARADAEAATRAKDVFLATVSHELRTPLQAMSTWIRVLRRRTRGDAGAAEALQALDRSVAVQARLIDELLETSRIVAGQLNLDVRRVELAPVVEVAVATARAATGADRDVTVVVDPGLAEAPVLGDPMRLEQIVSNLVGNALKFTPAGGRVDVRLERGGDCARMVVSDTGCGIAADVLPHVFDEFRQARSSGGAASGLGLGLAIVRRLVQLHGGTVRAESAGPGQGATFVVELPLADHRPGRPRLLARTLVWCVVTGLALLPTALAARPVAAADRVVYVAAIDGVIDLGLAPYVERVVSEAETAGAAVLVLDVNTFGGRVDAAVAIRDTLLRARVPTVAFVNKRAISAGALISLAAERIAVAEGATIGAATPVTIGSDGGAQPVSEKTVSYMRKEFRSTAEHRKRPPLIAEAMVDADVVVPGLVEKGKLLTLTTEEALKHRIADIRADSLPALLATLGLTDAEVRRPAPTWAEQVVRFLTHPVVTSLLMTVGILGVIVELRTPGFGVPGAVGIASLGLFFWGHWLVRLAGWEELLLVAIGIALLALELFVIPGFGIAGATGIVALVAGLGMTMVGSGATWHAVLIAAGRVAVSLIAALALSLVALRVLPRLPWGRRVVLESELPAGAGFDAKTEDPRRWFGKHGRTLSPLRPAGVAEIDGERVDVVSTGDFVEAGEAVEVVRVEGPRIVVAVRPEPNRGE